MGGFNIVTLNFSRFKNREKILEIHICIEKYNIDVFCLQEVDIESAVQIFRDKYHVIINWDQNSNSTIGIAILVKNNLTINDTILGNKGRIMGIK